MNCKTWLIINENGVSSYEGFRKQKCFNDISLYIIGDVYSNSMRKVSDLELLLHLKENIGNLRNYQGDFAGVLVNKKKVYIFSDRMCIRKIYYSVNKSGCYVATRMDVCAAKSGITEISDDAIAELMFEKALVSHTTWYKKVKALSVGEYMMYTLEEPTSIKAMFYDSSLYQEAPNISREEYAQELAHALEKSVLNMCKHIGKKKIALTFSAGWDSRLIASILKKHNLHAKALVVETDLGWDEISFAKEINDSYYHFDLASIHQSDNYYMDAIDKVIDAMEYSICDHLWFNSALLSAQNTNCVFLTGLGASNMLKANCEKKANMSAFYSTQSDVIRVGEYCASRVIKIPFIKKDYYEYLCECYHEIMNKELLPFMQTKNGGFAWYTVTRTSNQIMRIVDLIRPYFSTVHPFCSNNFLNLSLSPPSNVHGVELYKKIYEIIDKEAWELPSSNNAPEYKAEHKMSIKKYSNTTFNYMKKTLEEGILADSALINIDSLNEYILKNKPERVLRVLSAVYTYEKKLQTIRMEIRK